MQNPGEAFSGHFGTNQQNHVSPHYQGEVSEKIFAEETQTESAEITGILGKEETTIMQ